MLLSRCFPLLDGTSWVCYVAPSSRGRTMRPVGVTIIAVLTWIRGAFYLVIGLVLLVVGHLSARLVSTMATDSFFETLFSRVGKALGFGALLIAVAYIVVGLGLWQLKNWARTVTVVLVKIGRASCREGVEVQGGVGM